MSKWFLLPDFCPNCIKIKSYFVCLQTWAHFHWISAEKNQSVHLLHSLSTYLFIYFTWLSCLAVASRAKSQKIILYETSNVNSKSRVILWQYLQVMCAPQLFIYRKLHIQNASVHYLCCLCVESLGFQNLYSLQGFKSRRDQQ